jgi:hypothetical protein
VSLKVTGRVSRPSVILLAQDDSVEWVRATSELVLGKPQPLKGVEVHDVESANPIHEGFGEPGHPD